MTKKFIWDACSGTGSVQKAENIPPDTTIVEFDIEHKSPDRSNVIKIKQDITKIDAKLLEYYYNKYPPILIWLSPPCENFSHAMNDKNNKRNYEMAYNTLYSCYFIIKTLVKWNPDIFYFMENPKSHDYIQFCKSNNLDYQTTSYCLFNENINGIDTFPYRKHTIIVTNHPNLNLTECNNQCKMCINGKHKVTIGYKNNNYGCMTLQEYHKILKINQIIPSNHTSKDVSHRVPPKIFEHIINKCRLGMIHIT